MVAVCEDLARYKNLSPPPSVSEQLADQLYGRPLHLIVHVDVLLSDRDASMTSQFSEHSYTNALACERRNEASASGMTGCAADARTPIDGVERLAQRIG